MDTMEVLPAMSPESSRARKRSKPGDGGSDGKKKDKDGIKKAYIPSYVLAGEKCLVCGDNSTGTHYRAMTCEGCKGFFRRTIQKCKGLKPNLVCKKEEACEMTPQTRNACQFCRYKKCLFVKMDPASVLNEMQRTNLKKLIATNRKERQKRSKRSLTAEEWTELTQIANTYKSSSTHTFFSLLAKAQPVDKSYSATIVVGAGVRHAINFVKHIPGIDRINDNDLAELILHRLVDILALLMAEVFNVAENEFCFSDYRLCEHELETEYPKMERIYNYAKFYSRFLSHEGMVLGCLCAIRFLNSDGLNLKEPEKVDRALDYVVNLSIKHWATLDNNTLVKELSKGLPDFEDIRDLDLAEFKRITSMVSSIEQVNKLILESRLCSELAGSSPEYVNRCTSAAPSLRSSSASMTDTSEDEIESESIKHEMTCDEMVRFNQNANRGTDRGFNQTRFEVHMKPRTHLKEEQVETSQESVVSTSALMGGHGYLWQGLPQSLVTSSGSNEEGWPGNSSRSIPETGMRRMDRVLYNQEDMIPRLNELAPQISPEREYQVGFLYRNTQSVPRHIPHQVMPVRLDNPLPMLDPRRGSIPHNIQFESQSTVGHSDELVLREDDIEVLKKSNASLKEVVKHLCHMMELQGMDPNSENIWNTVQRRGITQNLCRRDVDSAVLVCTSNLSPPPPPPPPPLPISQPAYDLSILHHPEVSEALSSSQLTYSYSNDPHGQPYLHRTPPFINRQYSSTSSSSSCSLSPSPNAYQDIRTLPANDSDLRMQHRCNLVKTRYRAETNVQGDTYWQSSGHTGEPSSSTYNLSHSPQSTSHDVGDLTEPPIPYTMQSSTFRENVHYSKVPQKAHSLKVPQEVMHYPKVQQKMHSPKAPQKVHSPKVQQNVHSTNVPYTVYSPVVPHTSHATEESSNPFSTSLTSSSSRYICSVVTANLPANERKPDVPLLDNKSPSKAVPLKKKWLQAHFNSDDVSVTQPYHV